MILFVLSYIYFLLAVQVYTSFCVIFIPLRLAAQVYTFAAYYLLFVVPFHVNSLFTIFNCCMMPYAAVSLPETEQKQPWPGQLTAVALENFSKTKKKATTVNQFENVSDSRSDGWRLLSSSPYSSLVNN